MNIGIDIRPLMTTSRTGVGEYTFELLNAIFSIDTTNQYFLFYNSFSDVSKNIPRWAQNNVHYVATHWPNKIFNAGILLGLIKLDRVIARRAGIRLDYFFAPNIGCLALSKNTKLILTAHDLSFEFFPHFYTTKTRLWHRIINPKKLCERANIILAPSENTKLDIVNHYQIPTEKITVIYPGLSSAFVSPTPAQISDLQKKYHLPRSFILFLGTIEPRKNIIGLIEAFEKAYPNLSEPYHLIIAGAAGWKNKTIYDRAEHSPLHDKIQFIGYVTPDEKPALYVSAGLFVYPSFYEGFGFPILEAMASGIPVITSNRSSLTEIGASVNTLINPNNISELAATMTVILRNKKTNAPLGDVGQIIKKFNWQDATNTFLGKLK